MSVMAISTAEQLLAPISIAEFREKYLEKDVLHLERDDPSLVAGMFDMAVLENVIRFTKPWRLGKDMMHLIPRRSEDGTESNEVGHSLATDSTMPEHEKQAYILSKIGEGATLILNQAEEHAESVATLVDSLIDELACSVKCNVYCTPARSQAFNVHEDTHDVLVLQTHGQKVWRIYEALDPLPLEESEIAEVADMTLETGYKERLDQIEGRFIKEVTLSPGDVLYLPRGVPHCAVSLDGLSIHYTIGLYPVRQHQLLRDLVDLVARQSLEHRKRVPYGVVTGESVLPSVGDLFRALADAADAAEEPIDPSFPLRFGKNKHGAGTLGHGRLSSALQAKRLNINTVVRLSGPSGIKSNETAAGYNLTCGLASVLLPKKLSVAVSFLESNRSFSVNELPDSLSKDAKVVLVRKLLSSGVFVIEEIGDPTVEPDTCWKKEVASFKALN